MKWMGERIKERARERELSIPELYKALGVSRQSVNDWIGGKLPRGSHLVSLCRALQVSPNYFFLDTTDKNIVVPVHRTIRRAEVSAPMQDDALSLAKEYALFFKNSSAPELVPSYRGEGREKKAAFTLSKELRKLSGVSDEDPVNYIQAFTLMKHLGINVVFHTFTGALKESYAFYTKIYQHRVVFVNSDMNVLDLIFQLLHEAVHAVRDEAYDNSEYDPEEDAFCDSVANYVQFPDEYVEFVYSNLSGCRDAHQINTLKAFGKKYKHALYGLVKRLKESCYPEFSLNVGGADTNLKKDFPTLREVLLGSEDPRVYIGQLAALSPLFLEKVRYQLSSLSYRKLAELLDIENIFDAKSIQQELLIHDTDR